MADGETGARGTRPEPAGGEGRLLAGRYRLTSVIGRGGMGTVWCARDEILDRDVAVKEVHVRPGLTEDEHAAMQQRTLREARATAKLSHPGIITVHDVADEDDRPWIVMEYLPSRSLQDLIDDDGPLQPERAAEIGRQIAGALRAAHTIGILHRDIKPANVLITDELRAVVTDFGIAQIAGDARLTQTGMLIGSPAYMPPERARGEQATPASDLWALGATLYAACEGRPPYDRTDAMAALGAVLTEEPPPPQRAGPLTPVLAGLLARDPAQRLPADTAEAMLAQIARGTGSPASGGPGGPGGPIAPAGPGGPAGPAGPGAPAAWTGGTASPAGPAGFGPTSGTAGWAQHDIDPGTVRLPQQQWTAGPVRHEPAPPAARRRKTGVLVLAGAVAAAVLLAVGLFIADSLNDARDDGRGRAARTPATPSASASDGQSTEAAGTENSTGPSPTTGAPTPLPPGLRAAAGPNDTEIGVPAGWVRTVKGNSVYWHAPDSTAYMQIDRTPWSGDPYAHWEQWEGDVIGKALMNDYRRHDLRRTRVGAHDAADLEFSWVNRDRSPMRGLDRGVIVDGQSYAVFVAMPAQGWDAELAQQIVSTFRP